MMGAGLLSLPRAFGHSGLALGAISYFIIALLCTYTLLILIQVASRSHALHAIFQSKFMSKEEAASERNAHTLWEGREREKCVCGCMEVVCVFVCLRVCGCIRVCVCLCVSVYSLNRCRRNEKSTLFQQAIQAIRVWRRMCPFEPLLSRTVNFVKLLLEFLENILFHFLLLFW